MPRVAGLSGHARPLSIGSFDRHLPFDLRERTPDRLLADQARARRSSDRGGGVERLELESSAARPRGSGDPVLWPSSRPWMPAFAGMSGEKARRPEFLILESYRGPPTSMRAALLAKRACAELGSFCKTSPQVASLLRHNLYSCSLPCAHSTIASKRAIARRRRTSASRS